MAKTNKVNYRLIKKIGLLIVVACFIAGMFLLGASIRAIKEPLVFRSTVKPETFTELYFGDYLSLPSKIIYYQENKFSFIIHNLENEDMEYSYEIYIDVNGEKQVIDKNLVFIKNNEFKTISEYFTITPPIARARIIVNLINKNQRIYFWLENK